MITPCLQKSSQMATKTPRSYLFLSKTKSYNMTKKMSKEEEGSCSDISIDSLEAEEECKISVRQVARIVNLQHDKPPSPKTVLVPFYENDVLININTKSKKKPVPFSNNQKKKKYNQEPSNYLLNKKEIAKKSSYLEIFRKQLYKTDDKEFEKAQKSLDEAGSLAPEVGDTERSLDDDVNAAQQNIGTDFFDTEAYNEMLYEKLLNMDLSDQLSETNEREECLQLEYLVADKSCEDLRSVSEISRPRRRKNTSQPRPIPMKIGGLGPDLEAIRPRLERAKSVQRYSDKVREENRQRIYKKTQEKENKIQVKKEESVQPKPLIKEGKKIEYKESYLQTVKTNKKMVTSLDLSKHFPGKKRDGSKVNNKDRSKGDANKETKKKESIPRQSRSRKKDQAESKAVNTENKVYEPKLPMQFNFLVNLGGRPNSALKRMEDKHRMFQEKIKGFKLSDECFEYC